MYKEDFLKERRDREKLNEKCLELESKLREVHGELQVLKPQVRKLLLPFPLRQLNERRNQDLNTVPLFFLFFFKATSV